VDGREKEKEKDEKDKKKGNTFSYSPSWEGSQRVGTCSREQ